MNRKKIHNVNNAVNRKINKLVKLYFQRNYANISNKSIEDFINDQTGPAKSKYQEEWFKKFLVIDKKSRYLDYGCGLGNFIFYMWRKGYKIDGLEVNKKLYNILKLRLNQEKRIYGNIFYSINGEIPVTDNYYDIIFSYFVLEHVSDLYSYIKEGLRAVKKGGKLCLTTCNYKIGYEFHYCCFLPLFSKNLSRIILRLLKKDTNLFDNLNFVTNDKILRTLNLLQKNGMSFKVINVGKKHFLKDLFNEKIHSTFFIKIFYILNIIKFTNILHELDLYNPLVYLIIKK